MLENHADVLADALDVLVGDKFIAKIDFARSGLFDAVDATQKSGFARARRAENDDFFAGF